MVAQRLLDSLAEPFFIASEVRPLVTMSASIGVATGNFGSAEELLADADIALYEAKRAGRNRFVRFQPKMRRTFHDRLGLDESGTIHI